MELDTGLVTGSNLSTAAEVRTKFRTELFYKMTRHQYFAKMSFLRLFRKPSGEIEQNAISRLNNGQIEYYSYKPIAIGHELKIYYGEKYYTDLGYDPTPDDEDNISK